VHVRDAILPLADAGALELDVLWTALLQEAALLADEDPNEMELELVEDAGGTPRRLPHRPWHGPCRRVMCNDDHGCAPVLSPTCP
jgi:hypothetical protein